MACNVALFLLAHLQFSPATDSIITSKTPTFLCENGSSFIDLMIISKNLVSKVETCYTDSEVELFSGAPLRGHVPLIMKLNKAKTSKPRVTEKMNYWLNTLG